MAVALGKAPPAPAPQAGSLPPSGAAGVASGAQGGPAAALQVPVLQVPGAVASDGRLSLWSSAVSLSNAISSPPESATSLPAASARPMASLGGGLGRCAGAFWMALLFDAVGLAFLLVGVFVDVFFADLLIYGGGVAIFFSLLWWVFWYVGNLEVPAAELQDDVGLRRHSLKKKAASPGAPRGQGLVRLVRNLSMRFSGSFATFHRSPECQPGSVRRAHFADTPSMSAATTSGAASVSSTLELQAA
ncbi:transmembrane protein 238-like [Zootoca vivipara]|uniref:transmembrane protein 238-like n=1 Tax=Zootoca vivipara TaxID=8524 RepID=UPI00293B8CC3|nr:transmembrane protein 238-like [Zootoca vivipara]